jgi:hypothetical protein
MNDVCAITDRFHRTIQKDPQSAWKSFIEDMLVFMERGLRVYASLDQIVQFFAHSKSRLSNYLIELALKDGFSVIQRAQIIDILRSCYVMRTNIDRCVFRGGKLYGSTEFMFYMTYRIESRLVRLNRVNGDGDSIFAMSTTKPCILTSKLGLLICACDDTFILGASSKYTIVRCITLHMVAEKIQMYLRRWLDCPVCRDGTVGIRPRLAMKHAMEDGIVMCPDVSG